MTTPTLPALGQPRRPPAVPRLLAPFEPPTLPADAAALYREEFERTPDDAEAPIPMALPVHPLANRYCMLSCRELREMSEDIKARGQIDPIVMLKGKVLEGRNRLGSCLLGAVTPRFVEWDGTGGTPEAFVTSKNERRRNLSPVQRNALAAGQVARFEAESHRRMGEATRARNLGAPGGVGVTPPGKRDESRRATAQAAASVAGATVTGVKALTSAAKKDPRILTLASKDKITITQATQLRDMPVNDRTVAIARIESGEKANKVLAPKPLALAPPAAAPPALPKVFQPVLFPLTPDRAQAAGIELEKAAQLVEAASKDLHAAGYQDFHREAADLQGRLDKLRNKVGARRTEDAEKAALATKAAAAAAQGQQPALKGVG